MSINTLTNKVNKEDVGKETKSKIAVVVCSGASNTGQITNSVAQNLCKKSEKFNMICLAGLTQNHEISLKKVKAAEKIVIVDGCPFKCASKIIDKYTDRHPDLQIQVLEDYNVNKVSDPNAYSQEEVDNIVNDIINKLMN